MKSAIYARPEREKYPNCLISISKWLLTTCFVGGCVLASCVHDSRPIYERLIAIPTAETFVPVETAFGLLPDVYLCVLENYRDAVDEHFLYASAINEYIKARQFMGGEGNWTVIYGIEAAWKLEKILRRDFELTSTKPPVPVPDRHMCGYVRTLQIVKPANNRVMFVTGR